jgi:hypothetical protein
MKDEATGQPKLQISDDTEKEAKGQLKPPTNDEHQFHLDQIAIKDLKDGLNVMVDNERRGFCMDSRNAIKSSKSINKKFGN